MELETAVEMNSRHFPAVKNLAILYQKAGFRNKALEMWQRALSLAPDEATRAVLQALEGLAHLHAHGIAHGDIKPTNLLVRCDGRIAIGDHGFTTKLVDMGYPEAGERAPNSVRFSAPEQLDGHRKPQLASDVWSMAATLYFLLTLETPRDTYSDQTEREAAQKRKKDEKEQRKAEKKGVPSPPLGG